MTYALILIVAAMIARFVVFTAFPWMAKTASLYCLHNQRDKLYAIGRRNPHLAQTLFYQDLEFLLCFDIHVCRELSNEDALLLAAPRLSRIGSRGPSWREPVYEMELATVYSDAAGAEAQWEMLRLFEIASRAVQLRAMASRPFLLILMVPVGWIVFIASRVRGRHKNIAAQQALRGRVQTVATFVENNPSLLECAA